MHLGYENYVYNERWPKFVGYANFNTGTFLTASDTDNNLFLGSSSLYVSFWANPREQSGTVTALSVASSSGGNTYGYQVIRLSNTSFRFALYSASTTYTLDVPMITGTFSNYAFIYDKPAATISGYRNGTKVSMSSSVALGPIEYNAASVNIGNINSFIDEVRVMHTASELFHQKNYNKSVDSESYVKLKYSFNEGIVGTGSIDSVVIDYSPSAIHGRIMNYTASFNKFSGSAMNNEVGDPILYNFHSSVIAFTSSMLQSASYYDDSNNNFIFNQIGEYLIREDDKQSGLLKSFALAMGRYFDDIKLYVDQFENIKTTNYQNLDETPDLFLNNLKKYFGWKVTEHFNDANPLEFFFGENILASGSLQIPLLEIRNQFWRRILNNLPYLYSTKGKRNNLDSFFNILGLNQANIHLKEYGYVPGGSLVEQRIHKSKPIPVLGITGSLSSSYIKVPSLISSTMAQYTVESWVQLPNVSASFSANFTRGSIWQFTDATQVSGAFSLLWDRDSTTSTTGRLILTSSNGHFLSSSGLTIFNGDWVYIAAGRNNANAAFIEVKTIDNDVIDFSASFTSSFAISGAFTGSNYDFIIGANSGSIQRNFTKGYFQEFRVWNRALSSSEMNAHALHFENVGIQDLLETPHPLLGHWPLIENVSSSINGTIVPVMDFSRRNRIGTGSDFPILNNPYKKFLQEYNYISPGIDLKWTENKIRIRNKSFLKKSEIANDTNEVALEFNLVDALNEDIMKIFSTFDILNNTIGSPINKYREDYSDLEGIRRKYFERLGDSLNFNSFFNLFKWFDKKISESIRQLLPTRVKFIGGEQVVESHFLERPKYKYQYPVFRTPIDIPQFDIPKALAFSGTLMYSLGNDLSVKSQYVSSLQEKNNFINIPYGSIPIATNYSINNFYFGNAISYNLVDRAYNLTSYGNRLYAIVQDVSEVGTIASASIPLVSDSTVANPLVDGNRIQGFTGSTIWNSPNHAVGDIKIDKTGAIYALHSDNDLNAYVVKKSHVTASNSWVNLKTFPFVGTFPGKLAIDDLNRIYLINPSGSTATSISVNRSSNSGSTWQYLYEFDGQAQDIICSGTNVMFAYISNGSEQFYCKMAVTGNFNAITTLINSASYYIPRAGHWGSNGSVFAGSSGSIYALVHTVSDFKTTHVLSYSNTNLSFSFLSDVSPPASATFAPTDKAFIRTDGFNNLYYIRGIYDSGPEVSYRQVLYKPFNTSSFREINFNLSPSFEGGSVGIEDFCVQRSGREASPEAPAEYMFTISIPLDGSPGNATVFEQFRVNIISEYPFKSVKNSERDSLVTIDGDIMFM